MKIERIGKKIMKQKVVQFISSYVEEITAEEIEKLLEIPPRPEMGDFAFPCFRLAKVYRKAPQMIAEDLKNKMEGGADFLSSVENNGGYLNFFVDKEQFAKEIVSQASSENFGGSKEGE